MSDVADGERVIARSVMERNRRKDRFACVQNVTDEIMQTLPARIVLHCDRAPMNSLPPSTATIPAHDGPTRGIKCELYHDHRLYYAVTSRGERLPGVRVPIGLETIADVIADLWEALERADPRRPALVRGDDPPLSPAESECHCAPSRLFVFPRQR